MRQAQLPDADRVRGVFEEVLAGPDFHELGVSIAERLLRLFFRLLDLVLGDWIPALEDGQVRFLAWALVLATSVAVVITVWRRSTSGVGSGRRGRRTMDVAKRDAASWAKWARAERGAGRMRAAATGLYEAVVLHLETQGALRYGEWKTPGDYAMEIADERVAGPFESFLALFVEVAFGPVEPTDETVDRLFSSAGRLGCPV